MLNGTNGQRLCTASRYVAIEGLEESFPIDPNLKGRMHARC